MCMMVGLVAFVDAPVLVVASREGSWAVWKAGERVLEKLKSDERMIAGVQHRTQAWHL